MGIGKLIKLLFAPGLILIGSYIYSQPLELDTHHKRLADFLQLENSLGSLRLDSATDNILYEWDDENFNGRQENAQLSSAEINAFINKYKDLYAQVAQRFGKSDSKGNLTDLSKIKTGEFNREDIWKPDDSTKLDLYIVLSSKYEKNGPVTINPTYHIRLYIQNLSKEVEGSGLEKPDENKVKQLDSVLQAFMSSLKSNERGQARSFLSDRVASHITDDQLASLKQSIRLDDTLVVYFSGLQVGQDGSKYLMLQYKFVTDKISPPQVMIGVLFDEKNKILGIRQRKRQ
jgi:hypothetical protein